MSNVHGLGQYRNDDNNNNRRMGGFGGQANNQRGADAFGSQPLLGGGLPQQTMHPRKENFWDSLKFACCPTFTVASFIFFITLVDILMYITTLIINIAEGYDFDFYNFLGPTSVILRDFGMKYAYGMQQNYEFWRFILSLFLHVGILHLFLNVCFQLIIGFMLESYMGGLRLAALYFISGIGGVLFSCLCSPNFDSCGASPSLFGLFGGIIALVIVNWKFLGEQSPELRCMLACFTVFLIIFVLIFTMASGQTSTTIEFSFGETDIFGNLGGLIVGIFFGCVLMPPLRGRGATQRGSFEGKVKIFGIIMTLVYFVLHFTLFFTVIDTRGDYKP